MSKVLSTRLDEDVIAELDRATRRLGITKKRFLEEAIRMRAEADPKAELLEALASSFGAWDRPDQTPEETIREIKDATRCDEEVRREYLDSIRRWTP